MEISIDEFDRKILTILQGDAARPVADIAKQVGLSPTPCWRRIRLLEEAGVIRGRVALLDRGKLNVGVTVFVAVRTNQHNQDWLERFARAVDSIPEVVEFYRMSSSTLMRPCSSGGGLNIRASVLMSPLYFAVSTTKDVVPHCQGTV